jgi:hypothetical protein
MKKYIIYSVIIYMFGLMCILLNRPKILLDSDGNLKSWNYLKYKLHNLNLHEHNDPLDFICLPIFSIGLAFLSFYIAKQC